jgi:hypothetical protein
LWPSDVRALIEAADADFKGEAVSLLYLSGSVFVH